MRNEGGFALVLVLWALILLTGIGLSFGYAVRIETATGSALADQVRAEAAASAGIRRALVGLLSNEEDERWEADGRVYEIPWPDATLRATMRAENGKIDLNYAPQPLLAGLFANLLPEHDPEALADAVVDWRDRDDRRSPQGAEEDDYRAAGRRGPANQRLASVDELAQVIGFDAASVEQLRPYLTVYARRPRVDAGAAHVAVLAAIPGISRDLAEQFVLDRENRRAAEERPDLRLLAAGARYLEARPAPTAAISIRAAARYPGGAAAEIEAVVRLSRGRGPTYTILDWRLPLPELPAQAEADS